MNKNTPNSILSRRTMLMGSVSTLAVAGAHAEPKKRPQAQPPAQQASASGRKPNIVFIWGDDIGQTNLSIYSRGLMGTILRTSTVLVKRVRCSRITMASRAAPPAGRRLSPAKACSAPG